MQRTPIIRIVDDEPAIHDSLGVILDLAGHAVRHYMSAEELLTQDLLSDPGCAIVDLRMGGLSGLELQEELRRRGAALPLIFLSGHGTIDTAVAAMEAGAVTFLTKPVSAERLLEAIGRTLEDHSPERQLEEKLSRLALLSERETEIFRLLQAGLSCRTVGERLGISARTAEYHRTGIMRKLQCESVRELQALFEKAGR